MDPSDFPSQKIELTQAEASQLVPFDITSLIEDSVTDFNLFVRVGEEVVLYSGDDYRWSLQEIQDLKKFGLTHLFMQTHDRRKVDVYDKISRLSVLPATQSIAEKIHALQELSKQFTKIIFELGLTKSALRKGEEIVSALHKTLKENPTELKALKALEHHDEYTFAHSFRVACYAIGMAYELGIDGAAHVKAIGLGCLLHDIGKAKIPLQILNKNDALTEEEMYVMRSHVNLGHEAVKEFTSSHIVHEIVLHHHERLDGSGYPHGLSANDLMIEVQIASLADIFDAMTSPKPYRKKRSRYEAFDYIKHALLNTSVKPEVFKALVNCLRD